MNAKPTKSPDMPHEDDVPTTTPQPLAEATERDGAREVPQPAEAGQRRAGGFDPSAFRLSQDYVQMAGIEKLRTTIQVRKPRKDEFVRTTTSALYRATFAVIERKETGEIFLVKPDLIAELLDEVRTVVLVLAVNIRAVAFLWPVPAPTLDARQNLWHESAREACAAAQQSWVRVKANLAEGAYDVQVATSCASEPAWPTESFEALVALGFHGRVIDTRNHPVLRELRGEF